MKHKLISAFFFFISFVISFGGYVLYNKEGNITIPLFACLAFSALVAIGAEHYKITIK